MVAAAAAVVLTKPHASRCKRLNP